MSRYNYIYFSDTQNTPNGTDYSRKSINIVLFRQRTSKSGSVCLSAPVNSAYPEKTKLVTCMLLSATPSILERRQNTGTSKIIRKMHIIVNEILFWNLLFPNMLCQRKKKKKKRKKQKETKNKKQNKKKKKKKKKKTKQNKTKNNILYKTWHILNKIKQTNKQKQQQQHIL